MRCLEKTKLRKIMFYGRMNIATNNTLVNKNMVLRVHSMCKLKKRKWLISYVKDENPKGSSFSYVKINHSMDSWERGLAGGNALKQGLRDRHETVKDWLVREMGVLEKGGVLSNLSSSTSLSFITHYRRIQSSWGHPRNVRLDSGVTIQTGWPQSPLPSQITRVFQ